MRYLSLFLRRSGYQPHTLALMGQATSHIPRPIPITGFSTISIVLPG